MHGIGYSEDKKSRNENQGGDRYIECGEEFGISSEFEEDCILKVMSSDERLCKNLKIKKSYDEN